MNRFLVIFMIFAMSSLSLAKEEGQVACYLVDGMTCSACTITLKTEVKKLDGILSVEASVEQKSAIVKYDPKKTSADEINKKIKSIGYKSKNQKCSENKG